MNKTLNFKTFKTFLQLILLVVSVFGFSQTPVTYTANPTNAQINTALIGNNINITGGVLNFGDRATQIATFTNGTAAALQMNNGVFFGTGTVAKLLTTNNATDSSDNIPTTATFNDTDLTAIDATATRDVVSYSFTVTLGPKATTLNIRYQFGSEEYPDYVGSAYDDAMGFFVTGPGISGTANLARLPNNNPTSINKVNFGTPGFNTPGGGPVAAYDGSQSALYINNGHNTTVSGGKLVQNTNPGPFPVAVQFNGITRLITYSLSGLTQGGTYTFKIVIADAGDARFDSGVFINTIYGTATLIANNDTYTIVSGSTSTTSVLNNDSVNGAAPASLSDVLLSQISTTNTGVNLDPLTGKIDVAAGTPAGTYTVTYQICDQTFTSNCKTATATITVQINDSDNDGIDNYYDLDDDNDGILDTTEGQCINTSNPSTDGFDSPLVANVNGNNIQSVNPYNGWGAETGGANAFNVIRVNGAGYSSGPDVAQSGTQYIDINNSGTYVYKDIILTTPTVFSASAWFANRESSNGGYAPWSSNIQIRNQTTSDVVAQGNTVNLTAALGDEYWYKSAITSVSLLAGTYRIRMFVHNYGHLDSISYCFSTDTDGDGTPDHLDLDSDNDGCADAIEGGDHVTQAMLNASNAIGTNISGTLNTPAIATVDANGVPMLVNSGGLADIGGDVGQGVGDSQNIMVNSCAVPFICDTNMYVVQGNPSVLYRIDTSTNPFNFVQIGTGATYPVNATGYNPTDNFIYGINGGANVDKSLIRIDANGTFYNLGVISGLDIAMSYTSGEMDELGNYYIKLAGPNNNKLYKVDVATRTATLIQLSRNVSFIDIAYTQTDGLLWAQDTVSKKLVSINPTNGLVTDLPFVNTLNNYGAWFGSGTGQIYASSNDGTAFVEFNKTTGEAMFISTTQPSTNNDGAHCPTAPIKFDLYCSKLPVTNAGTQLPSNHGITALGRAGADNSNWPMVRQSAWTVLEAKTKGFVVNRVANPATDIANPVEGMMVFDTTAQCLKIYNGTVWSCYSTPACP